MLKTNFEVINLIMSGSIKFGCIIEGITLGEQESEFVYVTFRKDDIVITKIFEKHRTDMYDQWFEKYYLIEKGVSFGGGDAKQFQQSNNQFLK